MKVLVINPGATSTKIAVFDEDKQVFKKGIDHSAQELDRFDRVIDPGGLPAEGHFGRGGGERLSAERL